MLTNILDIIYIRLTKDIDWIRIESNRESSVNEPSIAFKSSNSPFFYSKSGKFFYTKLIYRT